MVIYRITNNINDKVYIGQTIQEIKDRFREHCKKSRQKKSAITSAIIKYGKENFIIEPLMTNIKNIEELNYWEKYWIKVYDSVSPNGYNLTDGGSVCRNMGTRKPMSDETKRKISLSLIGNQYAKGRPAWNKGMRKVQQKNEF